MKRFGVSETDYRYNWDRSSAEVEFLYKGEWYHFEHSVQNARRHGCQLDYGTDAFSQIVLALEALARITNLGIYDLQVWMSGLKFLPPVTKIPRCYQEMGFDKIQRSLEEIETRFKQLVKRKHPDCGGTSDDFINLEQARKDGIEYFKQHCS